jgi:citrate lyase subunit beta/citryl-CoA lyase
MLVQTFGPLDSAWGTPDEEEVSAERSARRERSLRLVRRSILIVPANVPQYVAKAHLRGADAVMLDLEDAVPLPEKERARELAREAVAQVARGGADVVVRINKPFALAVRDLDAVVQPGLSGLFFPKAEAASEIQILDRLLLQRELATGLPPGSLQIGVALESARGLFNAIGIATASPRIVSVVFGSEDVTLELGVEPTQEGRERFYGNAHAIMVAALAGIQPLGRLGNVADYSDLEAWGRTIREARRMGFKGSTCIHPGQVEVLNLEFSTDAAEVQHARQVTIGFEQAELAGRASTSVDGKMIDIPTVKRARQLLARAAAIDEMDARKRAAVSALALTTAGRGV